MTQYPTKSHYPDNELTSLCPILLMPSTRLGSRSTYFISHWFHSTWNRTPDPTILKGIGWHQPILAKSRTTQHYYSSELHRESIPYSCNSRSKNSKLHNLMVLCFCHFSKIHILNWTLKIYRTLVWSNFYFKWATFEIFEVLTWTISFGKHTKAP